jgi:hypothetical protein
VMLLMERSRQYGMVDISTPPISGCAVIGTSESFTMRGMSGIRPSTIRRRRRFPGGQTRFSPRSGRPGHPQAAPGSHTQGTVDRIRPFDGNPRSLFLASPFECRRNAIY